MSGLEQSFYIVGIIFMSVSLILIASLVTAVIVIRNKVVSLEKTVEEKLQSATRVPNKVVELANAVKEVAKAVK
jgi:cell division protein FtsL